MRELYIYISEKMRESHARCVRLGMSARMTPNPDFKDTPLLFDV